MLQDRKQGYHNKISIDLATINFDMKMFDLFFYLDHAENFISK